MKTNTTHKEQIEITSENLCMAKVSIQEMVTKRKLVINGEISVLVPVTFPSTNKKKEFRKSLERVINHPTMRNTNLYLHKLSKLNGETISKIEYSEKEKAIKLARKEWREHVKKGWELRDKYKTEKGDFYKS